MNKNFSFDYTISQYLINGNKLDKSSYKYRKNLVYNENLAIIILKIIDRNKKPIYGGNLFRLYKLNFVGDKIYKDSKRLFQIQIEHLLKKQIISTTYSKHKAVYYYLTGKQIEFSSEDKKIMFHKGTIKQTEVTPKTFASKYTKILRHTPLRAERMGAERLIEFASLYNESYAEIHRTTKKGTTYHYVHLDPLTIHFKQLYSFFTDKNTQKKFLLGLKGTGKTFNILLALNKTINDNCFATEKIKPCYISFDVTAKRVYIKPPFNCATKEQWENGKVNPPVFSEFDDYIEWANLIIFDEIHYFLEWVIDTKADIQPFITLINKILNRNCKILLVSENILMSYAEKIGNKDFDDICLKFGLVPQFNNTETNYVENKSFDVLALHEITGLTSEQLMTLNETYDLNCEPQILEHLSNNALTVRAFLKLLKILDWDITEKKISELIAKTQNESYEHIYSLFNPIYKGTNECIDYYKCSYTHIEIYAKINQLFYKLVQWCKR
ncbi:MAG: hypothetical protein QM398_11965 [Thermoproteota archaeon]|nr:hypothetical protein [Thermoproteota archaeon]